MKVDPQSPIPTALSRSAPGISFTGGGDFASKLTLGQIIKGRVLRSYDGGKYAIDFGGQQKIVDSAIPLRPDEVIVGRVIGLGEKVELQRIATHFSVSDAAGATAAPVVTAGGASADGAGNVFARMQAELSAADLALLQRAVGNAALPETMAQSGLMLSRLGIPLTPDLLRAVFDALRTDKRAPMFALPDTAIELRTDAAATALTREAIAGSSAPSPGAATRAAGGTTDAQEANDARAVVALPALLAQMLTQAPGDARAADRASGGGQALRSYDQGQADRAQVQPRGAERERDRNARRDGDDVARLIVNVQSGGAIAHRVGTLPLVVDGRLVELDVALFDQPENRATPEGGGGKSAPALRHRQLVFAVTTERLGRVEVRATTAGTHMRVQINTESSDSSQALARYAARLSSDLETIGWQIDELAYQTTAPAASGMVPRTVLEHLSAPGSVSALA